MNKKIFTLVAAFGLAASSFTAGAQAASAAITETMTSGDYYQLVVTTTVPDGSAAGAQYYIGVDNAKRDSLVLIKSDASDVNFNSSLNFWKVEYASATDGSPVFTITNKASGQKLAFPQLTTNGTANAILSATASRNALTWLEGTQFSETVLAANAATDDADFTKQMIDKSGTNADYKVFMYASDGGPRLGFANGDLPDANEFVNGVKVSTQVTAAASIYAVQPEAKAMTLTELNAIKGGEGFELTFTPDVANNTVANIFASKTLTAYAGIAQKSDDDSFSALTLAATNENVTTLKATTNGSSADYAIDMYKGKQGADPSFVDPDQVFIKVGEVENGAKKKVAMYAVVDTVYINGTVSYTIGKDSLIIANTEGNSNTSAILAAPNRDLASYMFTVNQNYATGELELIVAGTPVAKDSEIPYWKDDTNVGKAAIVGSAAYRVYIAQLGNAKELTVVSRPNAADNATVEAALAASKISFDQGTAVDNLNTKVAYYVQTVNEKGETSTKYLVAGNAEAASASDYVPATQWGLKHKGGNEYALFNRETGVAYADGATYVIDATKGIYRVGGKDVALTARADVKGENVGYKTFTESEVKNLSFAIKVQSLGSETVYLTTKDTAIVATNDADKKITFKLKANAEKAFGGNDAMGDSLVRTSYMLLSADKKSYLAYDKALNSFKMTSVAWATGNTVASNAVVEADTDTAFVYFQAVGENMYTMVLEKIYTTSGTNNTGVTIADAYGNNLTAWNQATAGVRKEFGVYGDKISVNITDGAVEKVGFSDAANTVFMIEDGAPDYSKEIQKPTHRTIALSSDKAMMLVPAADNFAALKREGQLKSDAFVADNFKLLVDTANMTDVNKPNYYIATGQIVSEECKENGELAYMVSLTDSAKVEGYMFNDYSRVGFINGKVEADTIALYRGHAAGDTATYEAKVNEAEWAMAINPNGGISLENAKDGKYVARINDVLVMVSALAEAAQFDLTEASAPVANDNIDAATVSVVASNGAVIINNAAGKKVAISNILGQTIANTVITSDNATIAAPAGVVVVAVEGEAAVKAIIK